MADHISPEEKLLRLIRGKTKKPKETSGSSKVKEYIVTKPRKTPDFYKIGIILSILVIVISLGYTIFESMLPQPSVKIDSMVGNISIEEPDKELIDVVFSKPYSYYSQYIDSRDIFEENFLSNKGSDDSLGSNLSDITLVGIVLDDIPQAIFEHSKDQETYFLKEGDSVGDIKVEEITEGRVTVLFEDEEVELKP